MGTIAIVISVAPAVGPTIGGAVLSSLGWRWMFGIVLPLAVVALVAGVVLIRLGSETRSVPLDTPSVVLSALGFGGVLFGLSGIGEPSSQPLPPWLSVVIGVVALGVFIWRQLVLQRRDRALLDLRPFTHRSFVVALVLTGVLNMCMIGIGAILLPLYVQSVLHQSSFVSGLAVLPGGLVLALLSRPVGALFDKIGARPLVIPGAIAMAVALWLFATLGPASPLVEVIGMHVLLMAAVGLMIAPLMTYALSSLPARLYSHGSAIMSTLQQLMGALGTALFVAVATLATVKGAAGPDAGGLRAAFIAAGCVGVIGVIGSLFLRKRA
jgi:DHA2 family lincomycin resistance protein-like MFS transporter